MASPTDIANLALTLFGNTQIASIEETTDEPSRVCRVNYSQARDECLAMARWSFAKCQVALSKLADAPLFDWSAAYELPIDFIRLVKIQGVDVFGQTEYFDVQGRRLLINPADTLATVNIEYIRREENSAIYSPLFVEAVSHKLAQKVCFKLSGSESRAKSLLQEFEQIVMPRCRTVEAQQRRSGENNPTAEMMRRVGLLRARR